MLDGRFHEGIREFNRRCFFEAHDVLEDLWHEYRQVDRPFLQGLIQIAVGFYHLENKNYKGSRSQLSKGIEKLQHYRPHHQGIDSEGLVAATKEWLERVERLERGEKLSVDSSRFPTIQYLTSASSQRR